MSSRGSDDLRWSMAPLLPAALLFLGSGCASASRSPLASVFDERNEAGDEDAASNWRIEEFAIGRSAQPQGTGEHQLTARAGYDDLATSVSLEYEYGLGQGFEIEVELGGARWRRASENTAQIEFGLAHTVALENDAQLLSVGGSVALADEGSEKLELFATLAGSFEWGELHGTLGFEWEEGDVEPWWGLSAAFVAQDVYPTLELLVVDEASVLAPGLIFDTSFDGQLLSALTIGLDDEAPDLGFVVGLSVEW